MHSTFVPHGHIGFTVSLKPYLNVGSFKWVTCNLKRDNNFTPILVHSSIQYGKQFLLLEVFVLHV